MKIESFVPGRVRLRSPLFKDACCAELIARGLMSVRGVSRAEANGRTGGMLLEYDAAALTVNKMMSAAPMIERISGAEAAEPSERADLISALLAEIKEIMEKP